MQYYVFHRGMAAGAFQDSNNSLRFRMTQAQKTWAVCSCIKEESVAVLANNRWCNHELVIVKEFVCKEMICQDHLVVSLHQCCLPRVHLRCAHGVIYQPSVKARQTHFTVFVYGVLSSLFETL